MAVLQQSSVDAEGGGVSKSCNLMISDDSRITKAVSFKEEDGTKIAYPAKGQAVILSLIHILEEILEVVAEHDRISMEELEQMLDGKEQEE